MKKHIKQTQLEQPHKLCNRLWGALSIQVTHSCSLSIHAAERGICCACTVYFHSSVSQTFRSQEMLLLEKPKQLLTSASLLANCVLIYLSQDNTLCFTAINKQDMRRAGRCECKLIKKSLRRIPSSSGSHVQQLKQPKRFELDSF